MAGHSQFKNIMHRKGAQDAKRAKIFTKIAREITVAVKLSGSDVNSNPRLRSAILEAREVNMPKDNIDRAIKRALGNEDLSNYEEIRYEGYGNGGVAVIVEALTDNRNRTASEVRSIFTKAGGNLGESGSVSFMFNKCGVIKINKEKFLAKKLTFDVLFEEAINLNASDCIEEENEFLITTEIPDLQNITLEITKKFNLNEEGFVSSAITWLAKHFVAVDSLDTAQSLFKLVNNLEDLDDVQKVYANFDINEDIAKQL
jgi:YebC/PmpR family DNA-binding regulatory protein